MSAAIPSPELHNETPTATSRAQSTDAPQHYLRVEVGVSSTIWARFLEPFMAGAEPVFVAADLPGGVEMDDVFSKIPDEVIAREFRSPSHRVTLVEAGSFTAIVERYSRNNGQVTIRAVNRETADKALAEVTGWFPLADPPAEEVSVDFWQSNSGMYTTSRSIDAPAWPEVKHYYPGEVSGELDELMSLELADPAGRVILWHGPPGTGKTSAIRALARVWRGQARFQVVLDPEPVFSHSSSLMEVILDDSDSDGKWRVLVIEDADDIVRADDTRTSQSLSRLLNVGDGIVGQGLKVLVLLTTNEPPARLHPALTRPGRCLSHVAFRRFTRTEVQDAFGDIDTVELPGIGDLSLAEILTGRRDSDDIELPGQYL